MASHNRRHTIQASADEKRPLIQAKLPPRKEPSQNKHSSNGCVPNSEQPWRKVDPDPEAGEISKDRSVKDQVLNCCHKTFTLENVLNKFPIVKWLPEYRCATFQSDLIAGLTVGLTVIPQGLAYAQVANLPPQYGLYSAFIGGFVYCVMGTSKDITLGPTAILSLMTAMFATSVSPEMPDGTRDPTIAVLLTLLCGIFQLILGILRLGILINFISFPVINAFTSAAAITIGFGQIKNLLGLKKIPDNFTDMVYQTFKKIPETRVWDLTMGITSFIVVMLLKKLRDIKWSDGNSPDCQISISKIILRKFFWIAGTACNAIVVITASGIVAIMEENGFNGTITVTGYIKSGLPDVMPPKFEVDLGNVTLSTQQIFSNLGTGLAIVPLLAVVETMAIGKAFARINKYKIDPTQELLAIGAANIISSFFQSYPITGSFSRTAVNSQSGVKTPFGGVWTGGLVILALCLLTPWFYYIPKSALAAVIISAILPMVEYHTVITLWKANRLDLVPYAITFICSLLIGIEYGILIGVGVSLLIILYPTARPKVKYSVKRGVLIVTPLQGLNFPAAEYIEIQAFEKSLEDGKPRNIILNMEHLTDVDYTAIQSLKTLLCDCMHHGIRMVLANGQQQINKQIELADIKDLKVLTTLTEALDDLVVTGDCVTTAVEDELEPFMSHL